MEREIKFKVTTEGGEQIEKTAKSLEDLAEAQKQTQAAFNKSTIGTEEYKKLSGELKNIEKAMGTAKTGAMGFGEKIASMGGPLGNAAQGFMGMTKAAMGFLATPIGAVIGVIGVALAAFTKAVKSNEAAMDALTKVTDTFSGIIQPVFDGLAWVAENVLGAFANGLAAIADAMGLAGSESAKFSEELDKQNDLEKDLAVSRAQTNKQIAEARDILSDSNATYEERTAALKKVQAAEEAQTKKEVENKKQLLALAQEQLKIDGASEENIQKIRDAKIALANVEQDAAAKQRQFNKLQKQLDKEAETAEQEKQKAAEARAKEAAAKAKERRDAALAATKSALEAEQKAKDEAYVLSFKTDEERAVETLKIQQKNQDKALQDKIDQFEKIKTRTKEENDTLKALKAQQAAEDIAQAAQMEALLTKQKADAEKKRIEDEKKAADESKAAAEKAYADKISAIDDFYKKQTAQLIMSGKTDEEIKKIQQENDLKMIQEKLDAAKAAGQQTVDLELQLAQKTKEIKDQEVKDTEEAEKKKAEVRMQQFNGVIQAATAVTGAIAAIQEAQMAKELKGAGDNLAKQEEIKKKYFEKQKKLQIANAIIGTIQGAVQAFTSLASIPVVGPALGGIAAAAALVAGYANVQKIRETQYEGGGSGGGGEGGGGGEVKQAPSMFADGGIVTGAGTGTSDSIPARLSNGESVINAKSTAQFAGLLSMINEAGGGKPFAGGGSVANSQTPVIKTYVVASEVTSQQEADFRIQQIAKL